MANIDEITPRNDVAFKMIFTDPNHERLLVHFLNCAVESKDPIKSAKILNNELTKKHVSQKGSRLDICAETDNGEIVDVEIQVGRDANMIGRSLFYWSKLFSGSLVVGDDYRKLRRTISINILNFKLFHDDERYWRKWHIADDETHEKMTNLLEIQFLELDKLKKFRKESPITFWIEFFKNPYSEKCKELYKFVPELKEAKEVFEAAKADPKKRRQMQEREDAIRNYASSMSQAEERGVKKERAKAEIEKKELIEKAEAEKKELLEKAEAEKKELLEKAEVEKKELLEKAYQEKIETAKNLLKMGLSVEQISQATGLSVEEIESLK